MMLKVADVAKWSEQFGAGVHCLLKGPGSFLSL